MPQATLRSAYRRAALALVLGIVSAALLLLGSLWAHPVASAQLSTAEEQRYGNDVVVGITDRAEVLSPGDADLLRTETSRIEFPPQVQHVEFLTFDDGDENLNDTTLDFAVDNRSDLISGDGNEWAPGTLLVATDPTARRVGVYCGNDVCGALDLFGGRHLDGVLAKMRDPMRRGNHAMGLLTGVQSAIDPAVLKEPSSDTQWVPWVLGGVGVALAGTVGGLYVVGRRKAVSQARQRHQTVTQEFGRIAGNLDGLEVRANSLTSPLADDELHSQWADVRDRFLELHTVMSRIEHLDNDSDDSDFLSAKSDIDTAHETVEQMCTAEDNIELLFQMEQGDAAVRRKQLGELRSDMREAQLGTTDEDLQTEVRTLVDKVDALTKDTGTHDFMDRYARIIVDYRIVVDAIREREFGDVEPTDEADDRHPPKLYENQWVIGSGYYGFLPFHVASSWHDTDVQSAYVSDSSTVTSYSNSSFSGGGGSTGY